jgi:hypothetical protein
VRVDRGEERSTLEKEHLLSATAQRENRRVVGVRVDRGEERSTREKEHLLSGSAQRERIEGLLG